MADSNDPVIDALRRAVEAAPSDIELRLHLGAVLLDAGRTAEAVTEAAAVLQRDPSDDRARDLMTQALAPDTGPATEAAPAPPTASTVARETAPAAAAEAAPTSAADAPGGRPDPAAEAFDWTRAEEQIGSDVRPPFVTVESATADAPVVEIERPALTLADVGGMAEVKKRLETAFLAPLRNPELRAMYSKSLKGGLLMYGPPGCGKTFIARALAGELGAGFLSLGVADVADVYRGGTERRVHEFFQEARRSAPVVVFIDELDALGQRRTTRNSWNEIVNQLLAELDGIGTENDGLYVLGATNQPWQVDTALRRPGRFDRTILVLPPDEPARREIFRHHLQDRPVEGIDLARLARASDALTGADIALVCETAVEAALMDSVATGTPRYVTMADLNSALRQTQTSIGPWLEAARNVVAYGEDDGTFGQLRTYLKSVKRL